MVEGGAPHALCRTLSGEEARRLDAWWASLPARERARIAETCARRSREDAGALRLFGELVDEGASGGEESFPVDLYEYLVNHEVHLSEEPERVFHVCTRHEAAARVVQSGLIPATFACPLGNSTCPMRHLLAAARGRSVRLVAERG